MVPRPLRLTVLSALATLVAVTMLATTATLPAHAGRARTTAMDFSFTLQSVDLVEQVAGSTEYGVNILEGTTRIKGDTVAVQRMSVTQYVDGSGPIGGFLTLTWPDGSRLGTSVTGQSQQTGSRTRVYGTLRVFVATGRWKGYGGLGQLTGDRTGEIGSPVRYRVTLQLSRA